jgi:sugar lactone lactonase YvrE
MAAHLLLESRDIVGERIVYDDRRSALVWVDIGGKRIHRLGLGSKNHELWAVSSRAITALTQF